MINRIEKKFNITDSWAMWQVPSVDMVGTTDREREVLFGAEYVPNQFPFTELPTDLETHLKQV